MSKRSDKLRQLDDQEADLRRRGQQQMASRVEVEGELQLIEKGLRDLISTYEQYFMGIDKFEPARERQLLTYRLRRMTNSYIPQADLRFRLQGLASRMQSYAAYWDRILRQIEEGRYIRQRSHLQRGARFRPEEPPAARPPDPATQHERAYHDLVEAYTSCEMEPPARAQFEVFLRRQSTTIREQFGNRPIDLIVVVKDGKPKLRVRART
jgi:hypothetical protein